MSAYPIPYVTCPFCPVRTGGSVCAVCLQALELLGRRTVVRARLQLIPGPLCCRIAGCTGTATHYRSYRGQEVAVCSRCYRADGIYQDGNCSWRLSYAF